VIIEGQTVRSRSIPVGDAQDGNITTFETLGSSTHPHYLQRRSWNGRPRSAVIVLKAIDAATKVICEFFARSSEPCGRKSG